MVHAFLSRWVLPLKTTRRDIKSRHLTFYLSGPGPGVACFFLNPVLPDFSCVCMLEGRKCTVVSKKKAPAGISRLA